MFTDDDISDRAAVARLSGGGKWIRTAGPSREHSLDFRGGEGPSGRSERSKQAIRFTVDERFEFPLSTGESGLTSLIPRPQSKCHRAYFWSGRPLQNADAVCRDGTVCPPGHSCPSHRRAIAQLSIKPGEFDDLGDQQVKKVAQPIRVYRVQVETPGGPPSLFRRCDGGPTGPAQPLLRLTRSPPTLCLCPSLTQSNRRGTARCPPIPINAGRHHRKFAGDFPRNPHVHQTGSIPGQGLRYRTLRPTFRITVGICARSRRSDAFFRRL
jgi:hypothetical protein